MAPSPPERPVMPYQLLLMAPRIRRVLGLPAGSIRALLTLMTVGFIIAQTVHGRRVSLLWFESLIIVLAHYFAHRRFVALSPSLLQKLTAEDLIEDEPHPLFLPRHTLRTLIVVAFGGLAVYLGCVGRLHDPVGVPVLVSVGSYFLGIVFGAVAARYMKGQPSKGVSCKGASWFDDLKAIVTLLAVALAIAVQLFDWQSVIPFSDKLEALPLALMLFYFGSR